MDAADAEPAEELEHGGQRLLMRRVRPEDSPLYEQFLGRITQADLRRRFFSCGRQPSPAAIAQFTRLDPRHDVAFVAISADNGDSQSILAVAQAHADDGLAAAEFALLVRSDLKGRGLGRLLLLKLIRCCRRRGTRRLHGFILADNTRMARLARALGFRSCGGEGGVTEIALAL